MAAHAYRLQYMMFFHEAGHVCGRSGFNLHNVTYTVCLSSELKGADQTNKKRGEGTSENWREGRKCNTKIILINVLIIF